MPHLIFWVVAAHFLALLSPGPDFFLVVRTALRDGHRPALWACAGIAAANAFFIACAFGGVSLLTPGSWLFLGLQAAGGLFLLHLGIASWRHAGRSTPTALVGSSASAASPGPSPSAARGAQWQALRDGLASGLLNPKNAMFYASLAALLGADLATGWRWLLAVWMVSVVFLWDALLARTAGRDAFRQRLGRHLPALTRACGAVLAASGATLVGAALLRR